MGLKQAIRRLVRSLERGTPKSGASDEVAPRPVREKRKKKSDRYRRDSNSNIYDALDYLRSRDVRLQHQHVVERIRSRLATDASQVLRVAFVVSSPSRWNSDSILQALNDHPRMSAEIVVRRPEYKAGQEEVLALYNESLEFFSACNAEVRQGFDTRRMEPIPIEDFDYDVFFFEMPWGMRDYPVRLVGRALPAYMHYGFMLMGNHGMHYNVAPFHSYLWRYFTQTETHRRLHLEHDPHADDRIFVSGYPKLDAYEAYDPGSPAEVLRLSDTRTGCEKSLQSPVIFAPHHSLGKQYLSMSTFDWSGGPMQALAQQNSSIDWVYKPHPSLWYNVAKAGHMTSADYSAYELDWSEMPNAVVFDSGGYFDLFKNSSALITCSGSFLAEYLPTGKPIIWLKSSNTVGLNRFGQRLAGGFYVAETLEQLYDLFNRVVVQGDDYLRAARAERAKELFPKGRSAGRRIVEELDASLVR